MTETTSNQASDSGVEAPAWRRKRSMLTMHMARSILRYLGEEPDESQGNEIPNSVQRFVFRARPTSPHDFETERLTMRLRPMSDDDPDGDPVMIVRGGGGLPDGPTDELLVTCVMGIESVEKAPPASRNTIAICGTRWLSTRRGARDGLISRRTLTSAMWSGRCGRNWRCRDI